MTNAAAFRAGYADWKLVKTRGVVQIVLEIPIEASGQAYDVLGGMPNPASEVWVAVARLREEVVPNQQSKRNTDTTAAPVPTEPTRPVSKRNWNELSPAQQAGIRCNEPAFWRFLRDNYCAEWGEGAAPASEEAARVVRLICGVGTRAAIKPGTEAEIRWSGIDSCFQTWMREPELVG